MKNREMLKRISVKCVAAIMAAAVAMSAFGAMGVTSGITTTVYAAHLDDNPAGSTTTIGADDTMDNNYGDISSNAGSLGNNWGRVDSSAGGSVGTNHESGDVTEGSITDNYGTAHDSNVTNNYESGTVTGGNSNIENNWGTAQDVENVGNNMGTVTGDDVIVTNNYAGGTVNETPGVGQGPSPAAGKATDPQPNPPAPAPQPQPEPPQDNGSNNDNAGSVDNSGSNNAGVVTYPEPFSEGFSIEANETMESILAKLQASTAEEALLKILSKLDNATKKGIYITFPSGGAINHLILSKLEYSVVKTGLAYKNFQWIYVRVLADETFLKGKTLKEKREIALKVCFIAEIDHEIYENQLNMAKNRRGETIKKALSDTYKSMYASARLRGFAKREALEIADQYVEDREKHVENLQNFAADNNLTPGAVTFVGGSFDGQDLENGMSVPTAGQNAAIGLTGQVTGQTAANGLTGQVAGQAAANGLTGGVAADGTLQGGNAAAGGVLQGGAAAVGGVLQGGAVADGTLQSGNAAVGGVIQGDAAAQATAQQLLAMQMAAGQVAGQAAAIGVAGNNATDFTPQEDGYDPYRLYWRALGVPQSTIENKISEIKAIIQ